MQSTSSFASGGLSGVSFPEQERSYYQTLFAQAPPLEGLQGAQFLSRSGIEKRDLKKIWDIADAQGKGRLGFEEFSVAMRLVAHYQAGRPVSSDLVHQIPSATPRLEGLGPSTPPATGAAVRGRSPPRGEDRRTPTPRDLRKYGREFSRRVLDQGRQHMSGQDAREMFGLSGLGIDILQQIWHMADHDGDGQLSWAEFVLAMHLIRRARADQALPQGGLPAEMTSFLVSLEPPEVYARQESRSPRSHSAASSPFGSRSNSVARGEPEQAPGSGGAFNQNNYRSSLGDQQGSYLGSTTRYADTRHTTTMHNNYSSSFGDQHVNHLGITTGYPDTRQTITMPSLIDSGQPVEHLEVLIEADKQLVRQLRRDTDLLHEELTALEKACRHEEQEAVRERADCDRAGQERQNLLRQLEATQRQLAELKVEHQGLHAESVLLRRDTDHYSNEAAFLQKLFEEGMRDAHVLQQSIEYLEQSNQSLSAHTKSLEEARREVLTQVNTEKELLRAQEREVMAAKHALDTMKSGSGDGLPRVAAGRPTNDPLRDIPVQKPSEDGQRQSRQGIVQEPVAAPWHSTPFGASAPNFGAAPAFGATPAFGDLGSTLGAPGQDRGTPKLPFDNRRREGV